jgi:hypothetical protein
MSLRSKSWLKSKPVMWEEGKSQYGVVPRLVKTMRTSVKHRAKMTRYIYFPIIEDIQTSQGMLRIETEDGGEVTGVLMGNNTPVLLVLMSAFQF